MMGKNASGYRCADSGLSSSSLFQLALIAAIALWASSAESAVVNITASTDWELFRNLPHSISYSSPGQNFAIPVDEDNGAGLEFDLGSIPDTAVVQSARLSLGIAGVTATLPPNSQYPAIDVYAATGSDIFAPQQNPSIGFFQFGPNPNGLVTIDLDTTAVANHVTSAENLLNIHLFNDLNTLEAQIKTIYATQIGFPPIIAPNPAETPRLEVTYVIPEPGALSLVVVGWAASTFAGRRSRPRRRFARSRCDVVDDPSFPRILDACDEPVGLNSRSF